MRCKKVNVSVQDLVKLLFALTAVHIVFLPLRINAVLYPVRVAEILVVFSIGVLVCDPIKARIEAGALISCLTIVFIIVGNFVAYSIAITIDNLLSVLCVLCLLLLVYVSDKIEINKSSIDFFYYCSIMLALIMLTYSQTSYAHWNGEREHDNLTLGIENPNLTAIILFLIYAMLVITMRGRKHLLIPVALEIALLWLIWQTNSRMVLAAALLLAFMILIPKQNLKPIPLWVVRCACLLPFVFVPAYLIMYENFGNFELLNKSFFSGRQYVFAEYLGYVDTLPSFLFGNLRDAAFQNAHNGPLAIITSIGIVGGTAYFYIIINAILKTAKKAKHPIAITSIVVIMACFVHTCGEAALLLGGFPGITFLFLAFMLSNVTKDTGEELS